MPSGLQSPLLTHKQKAKTGIYHKKPTPWYDVGFLQRKVYDDLNVEVEGELVWMGAQCDLFELVHRFVIDVGI